MSLSNQPQPAASTSSAGALRQGDGQSSATSLKAVVSKSGFTFPPIWSFPPFFTLQPNPATLTHQLDLWRALLLSWAKYERVYEVDSEAEPLKGSVFVNDSIQRRLLPVSIKRLFGELVKNGQAAPDPPKQDTRYLIYWRRPEEWGDLIYTWIIDNGLNGSIMTFYEITDGDLSHTTEFYQLHPAILRKALETLVKRGKAQLLEGKDEMGEGVRFL